MSASPVSVPAVLALVQVHYRSFPEDILLRWDGMDGLKAHHFSSMKVTARRALSGSWVSSCMSGKWHWCLMPRPEAKIGRDALLQEAACICEGKAKPVMDLPNRDKDSLWDAINKVSSQHCIESVPLATPGPAWQASPPLRLLCLCLISMRSE